MKIFSGLLGSVIILLAVVFALANRQAAVISLWPLGVEIQAPLYLLTLGTLFFGVLVGAAIAWFSLLPHRLKARQLRKDLVTLQDRVTSLQQAAMPPVVTSHGRDDSFRLMGPKSKWRFWESQS